MELSTSHRVRLWNNAFLAAMGHFSYTSDELPEKAVKISAAAGEIADRTLRHWDDAVRPFREPHAEVGKLPEEYLFWESTYLLYLQKVPMTRSPELHTGCAKQVADQALATYRARWLG